MINFRQPPPSPNTTLTITGDTDYRPPEQGEIQSLSTKTIELAQIEVPINVYDPNWSVEFPSEPRSYTKEFKDLSLSTQSAIVRQLQELNNKLSKFGVFVRDLRNLNNPFFISFFVFCY